MLVNIIVLFLAGISGAIFLARPLKWKQENVKPALAFAGGFLLSITLLHIMPDVFQSGLGSFQAGLFILLGFFLQQILEYFTDGVEHGHFHNHSDQHSHKTSFGALILFGLFVHSFLEGAMLSSPASNEMSAAEGGLLTAIVLHKIPASLALASVLICSVENKKQALLFITIFALASPAGLVVSDVLGNFSFERNFFAILIAIVSGNFLHISTTIVFEGSPNHSYNFKRLLWSLIGAGAAIVAELLN